MNKTTPRFPDKAFFLEELNLDYPGMGTVAEAARAGDFASARKAYANFIRRNLKPEQYFTIPYDGPEGSVILENETNAEAAERAYGNCLVSCRTPYQFGKEVDWLYNPTEDHYEEWSWQLNRHSEWKIMAQEYRLTGDERFPQKCAEFLESWLPQAGSPGPNTNDSVCWRTIEAGIRMGLTWPYALHAFCHSPAFTDDVLVDWAKSVCEHGYLLREEHTNANWLIMEMNGLGQLSIFFPEFKKSPVWQEYAFRALEEELGRQFYPDGFQYELSTNYHETVLLNYSQLLRVAKAYGVPFSEKFITVLERAVEVNLRISNPEGRLPDINDGCNTPISVFMEPKLPLFAKRDDFEWAVSHGKTGAPPAYTSTAFPYSGFMVMRDGWQPDSLWAFLDAAPFGFGHHHEDKLSLLLYANGKQILTEGGNYAYDRSPMRHYVCETPSHNTIRVDRQNQNRRKNYQWHDEDIAKLSGMKYRVEDGYDFAEGVYDEGYGPDLLPVSHQRSVYFLKKPVQEGVRPFFLVVDRLFAKEPHEYEILWHLDNEQCALSDGMADTPELRLLYTKAVGQANRIYGQTEPEWQGWVAAAFKQGAYRPVSTVQCLCSGTNLRVVTVLDPYAQLKAVSASDRVEDTGITLELPDGSTLTLDEKDFGHTVSAR